MRILSILLCLTIVTSCRFGMGKRVTGNGNVITQHRTTDNFNRIDVSGSVSVILQQGDVRLLKVETDENLMPYVEVFSEDNVLVIREKPGYNLHPSGDLVVHVWAPVIKGVEVSGAGGLLGDLPISEDNMEIGVSGSGVVEMDIDVSRVSVDISGSGEVLLRGRARELEGRISGSGELECFDLEAENASVSVSGAGNAYINASNKISAKVSGSGTIKYRGTATVDQSISGAGTVEKG